MALNLTRKVARLPVWLWAALVLGGIGGLSAYVVNQPDHAGWRYGACKVFLEQYVRFPDTIDIKVGAEMRASVAIGFSDINPFGAQQIRVFECYFSQTQNGEHLSRITIDRKALPDDIVKKFDAMLPLLANLQDLDTALPGELPNDLEDLKE